MERSDETLIIAHRQGDGTAFGELVARHATPLLNYLTRMIGDRQQAEDLFQETFLRVHSKAWSFCRNRSFKPWLFTIATRMAIDSIRKRQRRPMLISWNNDSDYPAMNSEVMQAPASNPGDDMVRSERKQQVKQAVNSLPAKQRAALILALYQGLSYSEVAKVMRCSISTVKTHMARALRTLARLLPNLESEAT